MNTLLAFLVITTPVLQDTPQDIARKDLPKLAECVVCTSGGESHGKEKPVAGVMYKGTAYYFCNAKEVAAFKKDPNAYLPLVLPGKCRRFP